MRTEAVPETSAIINQLTRLIAREGFIISLKVKTDIMLQYMYVVFIVLALVVLFHIMLRDAVADYFLFELIT
jgi:hypothetical protein